MDQFIEQCPKCSAPLKESLTRSNQVNCPFCGINFRQWRALRALTKRPVTSVSAKIKKSGFIHFPEIHKRHVEIWAQDKTVLPRVIGLILLILLTGRYLYNPTAFSVFDSFNLIIHEAGHLLFRWFGTFFMFAGGTFLQVLAPIACGVYMYMKPDFFGVSFSGIWLSTNLYHVATYVADAKDQMLPLVSVGGGEPQHDWTYLLSVFGMVDSSRSLGFIIRCIAFLCLLGSFIHASWIIYKIRQHQLNERSY